MHTEQPEAEPETMTHNDVVPGTSLAMLQSSSEIDREKKKKQSMILTKIGEQTQHI